MADQKLLPGKFVWFEHVSRDAKKAQGFYGEVLGWRVVPFVVGAESYEMIYAGESMQGGYADPEDERQPAHWISYVSVEDVDGATKAAAAAGGKVVKAAFDSPTVGRMARIADPQGAQLYLFRSETGNAPDLDHAPHGFFLWNELHTTDAVAAAAFYGKVVGFGDRPVEMGPGGTYHILSRDGVDRAGATQWLAPGTPPHWLPYVSVDDVDAAIARARHLGATIPMNPDDIPDIGRIGVLIDPQGAALAVMKPLPRMKKG
jgi:predicted enzyme related to lactoylglutathione lyase